MITVKWRNNLTSQDSETPPVEPIIVTNVMIAPKNVIIQYDVYIVEGEA